LELLITISAEIVLICRQDWVMAGLRCSFSPLDFKICPMLRAVGLNPSTMQRIEN
jgi:hypothetical protein